MYTVEFGLATLHLILLVHTVVPANDDSYNINLKKFTVREHVWCCTVRQEKTHGSFLCFKMHYNGIKEGANS